MDAVVKALSARAREADAVRRREAEEAIAQARPSREEAEAAVRTLIRWAGDDPNREGLLDTPRRVAEAHLDLFKGYREDPEALMSLVFEEFEVYGYMVLV